MPPTTNLIGAVGPLKLACLMGASALGAYWLAQRLQAKKAKLEKAFWLIIKYRLHNPEDIDLFLQKWADLAKHCERSEPHTHAYEIAISDKEPQDFVILERYRRKEDLTDIHMKSKPFQDFKAWLTSVSDQIVEAKSGQSYIESNVGFVR